MIDRYKNYGQLPPQTPSDAHRNLDMRNSDRCKDMPIELDVRSASHSRRPREILLGPGANQHPFHEEIKLDISSKEPENRSPQAMARLAELNYNLIQDRYPRYENTIKEVVIDTCKKLPLLALFLSGSAFAGGTTWLIGGKLVQGISRAMQLPGERRHDTNHLSSEMFMPGAIGGTLIAAAALVGGRAYFTLRERCFLDGPKRQIHTDMLELARMPECNREFIALFAEFLEARNAVNDIASLRRVRDALSMMKEDAGLARKIFMLAQLMGCGTSPSVAEVLEFDTRSHIEILTAKVCKLEEGREKSDLLNELRCCDLIYATLSDDLIFNSDATLQVFEEFRRSRKIPSFGGLPVDLDGPLTQNGLERICKKVKKGCEDFRSASPARRSEYEKTLSERGIFSPGEATAWNKCATSVARDAARLL